MSTSRRRPRRVIAPTTCLLAAACVATPVHAGGAQPDDWPIPEPATAAADGAASAAMAGEAGDLFGSAHAAESQAYSTDEVRAVVADMLADAETRSSLLQSGGCVGYDESAGFFILSSEGSEGTRSSPRTSRAGWSGGKPPSGPCRDTSRTNSAAISSAGSSASASPARSACRAARGSSWPSPARAAVSARPATAATWPRPPPTSPIMSSRRCPCGSG